MTTSGRDLLQPNLDLEATSLEQFLTCITERLGIKMNATKLPMLQGRLRRRLHALGLASLEEYRELLFGSPAGEPELTHFFDAVTTNKTDFFREPQHFRILTEHALPKLERPRDRSGRRGRRLHVWCAGCSTGEEPHTLALVLSEHRTQEAGFDFAILATDVSSRVLEHARTGIYDIDRVAPVPRHLRDRYFLRAKDPARRQVRVAPALRQRIAFHRLNFMDADYRIRDTFDVVFFRNVLIYFDKATQAAVVRRIARHLRKDGYLFIGHSESLAGLDLPFEPLGPLGPAVYRHTGGTP
jgi:chemotaxis protein methyltransferase CheR